MTEDLFITFCTILSIYLEIKQVGIHQQRRQNETQILVGLSYYSPRKPKSGVFLNCGNKKLCSELDSTGYQGPQTEVLALRQHASFSVV
jgi:hypothetical protein